MEGILRDEKISEMIPFDYSEPVLFFPVRHHSPTCSYHLMNTIKEYKPDCILVEGPVNANKLIGVLTSKGTKPPVAFYYYYKDTAKYVNEDAQDYKCYYPFLSMSPEYNALRYASLNGIECSFIDLPYGEILINTAEGKGLRKKQEVSSYSDEHYLSESKYFKALCEKTGMRDFEEFWETYFETGALSMSTKEYVKALYTYCIITRNNTPEEEMKEDGCLVRESYMADCIRQAEKTHSRVLVVTGGFHSYGLYSLRKCLTKPQKYRVHKFTEKVQDVYAMPYSYEAADALGGYSSGMQNPWFYQQVWDNIEICDKPDADEIYGGVLMDMLVECAKRCTKNKLLITMSDITSAVTMYEGLAMLRGKKAAGLYDLYDGVQSSFIKGELNANSSLPLDILSQIATGSGIGELCDEAEKVPIVRDFEEKAKKYKLKIDSVNQEKIELDIFSKPLHMEISRFFYRMYFIRAPFALREKGADIINNIDRSRIREIWTYQRNVSTDSSLIDVSVNGATIEEACCSTAAGRLRTEQKCSEASKIYVESFLMGINTTDGFSKNMLDIINNDGDFFSIGKGVYYFNTLCSLRKLYKVPERDEVLFLRKCFDKIIVMLPSMINVNDDHSSECIKVCRMLYGLVNGGVLSDKREVLIEAFETMTEKPDPSPSVLGAVVGLLYGSDKIYKRKIRELVSGYLSGTTEMKKQGAVFIRGLFSTARDIALVGDEFIRITDELIDDFDMIDFMEILPELRLAFSYFTPSETDSIAKKAATLYNYDFASLLCDTPDIDPEIYALGLELEKEILDERGE